MINSRFHISEGKLKGELRIPSSKSHSIRAILFASLARGESSIEHVLHSPDIEAMICACRQYGAKIMQKEGHLYIEGTGGHLSPPEDVIHAGNSGLVLRFIGALAGLCTGYTLITGDESIRRQRPARPLLAALTQLGAFAESSRGDGLAPLIIKGPIRPGFARIDGADSQPVSGMLIALSLASGKSVLQVDNPGETPWVGLTLDWLNRIGAKCSHVDFEKYEIEGSCRHEGFDLAISGDFSSAAYPLVAAILTGSEITLHNLDMTDSQGDKAIISLLNELGARIEINENERSISVKKSGHLVGKIIDVNRFIDALPILAVVGCFAEGQTTLINGAIARKKESDRIASMARELKKMGATIEERPDGLVIKQCKLKGAQVNSHSDHRVAMSLVVAGLGATGETIVEDISCVNKSYPDFKKHLVSLGVKIHEEYCPDRL